MKKEIFMNEIKVATVDLYNNERNEGMRCIKEIVLDSNKNSNDSKVIYDIYDTRYKSDIPDLNYDIYISSGGPGSPFEGEGKEWEKKYFNLIDKIWNHNQTNSERKKYIFFICHSFQLMNRFFKTAEVNKRFEKSFGVVPFTKTEDGENDPVLKQLPNPFYSADFREWEVVNPNEKIINEIGAKILSTEIQDKELNRQPAIMAMRISNEIMGTQFHPEADPASMLYHLKQEERKKHVIDKYGKARYDEMLNWLEDPDKIKYTRKTVLPSFLNAAIDELNSVLT